MMEAELHSRLTTSVARHAPEFGVQPIGPLEELTGAGRAASSPSPRPAQGPATFGHLDHELAALSRDGGTSPHPQLMQVVHWLHPWNVVVDAGGRLWVLDWDWQIGDARFDLAWTCTLMERSGHHAFSSAVQEQYARPSGRPVDDFASFGVLATVRWLLNVLPAVGSNSRLTAAARADFRSFLIEPVRQAQALLQDRGGIAVTLQP